MTERVEICTCCKGNGFKYLSFKPIITEPCSECKMTGEVKYTDYKTTQNKGFSHEQTRR